MAEDGAHRDDSRVAAAQAGAALLLRPAGHLLAAVDGPELDGVPKQFADAAPQRAAARVLGGQQHAVPKPDAPAPKAALGARLRRGHGARRRPPPAAAIPE